jgi:hypothetical protein
MIRSKVSYFWAEFQKDKQAVFRIDIRIYFDEISFPDRNDICIGAIVGKNPGSAKASYLNRPGLQPILLDGDKLLPTVRNIVVKAYRLKGENPNHPSYIQVLNLFYLCEPNLSAAIKMSNVIPDLKICHSETKNFPWVWYGWGGENKMLSKHKLRFKRIKTNHSFFYDKNIGSIESRQPSTADFAKHTQGLKHDKVVPYIANLL